MKQNLRQKGGSEIAGLGVLLGGLLVLGLIIAFILWLFGFNFGYKSEGTVTYGDCRQEITLEDGSWQTYFHSFTCSTYKTKSGVVMRGECVAIKNDRSFFGSSHTCATAYVYEIKPSTSCSGSVKDGVSYPYLGYDDMCHTTSQ